MAIHIFCSICKTSNSLTAKKCSNCGRELGRGKKYRVTVSHKGQRVTRVVDNLTIARGAEADIKRDLQSGEFDIRDHRTKMTVTLDDVWKKYLPWAKSEKKKSWMTDDFFYRKHLQPRFGSKPLEKICAFDIERLKVEMKQTTTPQGKQGYADATIRHQLVLLSHLFNKAKEWRMYEGENPASQVKTPKVNNEITEYLTDEEMASLIDTLNSWPCKQSADFVKIALFAGLRRGEIMKLEWDAVNLDRQTITLRDPKGGKDVMIPISDQASEVFRGIERTSNYVLPGPDGRMKKTFRDPWYRIRKAAGLPGHYRLHGLRHNFASHLVSAGMDLFTVSKLLTHKDMRTTEKRYAHLSDERLRHVAQMSGELLTKQKTPVIPLQGKE